MEPNLWIIFLLGLRHGLDADHLAIINGSVSHAAQHHPRRAPWMGTFFSLGHGVAVTALAVGVGLLAGQLGLSRGLRAALNLLPPLLLLILAALNLWLQLRQRVATTRDHWALRWLGRGTHPATAVGVGLLYGLVFEAFTQAATWGAAAAQQQGVAGGLLVGLAFTAGMVFTDTADSWLAWKLLSSAHATRLRHLRTGIAAVIALVSVVIALVALRQWLQDFSG